MSIGRIAGLVRDQDTGRFVTEMLRRSAGANTWVQRTVRAPGAALGWTGRGGSAHVHACDAVLVVLDGCIYNAPELGGDPGDMGRLVSDLYRQRGFEGALEQLNGDFAIALYDDRLHTLYLGRDRMGVKPLYYAAQPGVFAFASRPRALFAVPGVTPAPDRGFVARFAACHYRYFDNAPDRSAYRDVAQLPAGCILEYAGGRATVRRYWSFEDWPFLDEDEAELAGRYRSLLLDAVHIRARVSRRPAFTLSGGMDSSSVLACAAAPGQSETHAFSTVYDDSTYDESEDILPMLEGPVDRWHAVAVGNGIGLETVAAMIEAHDEPVATATWLSHHRLCGAAAEQGFDALLGGLGGDELNAGEYEHFWYHFADLRAAGDADALEREVRLWIRHHDHPIHRKSPAAVERAMQTLVDPRRPGRCLPDRRRMLRYARALSGDFLDLSGFEPAMDHPFSDCLRNRTAQDLLRETMPCCLRAEDRHGAAFGLETRLPFLDHRVVEFMFRVRGRHKIRGGVTKRLLRAAMDGLLPETTRTRIRKTGWNAPAHLWFAGEGRTALGDLVGSRAFRERGIYDVAEVERIIDEHHAIVTSGRPLENHMMFLWQLVNLELWLRTL